MNSWFKKAIVGAAFSVSSLAAFAAPITVGGVTWDPDDLSDFSGISSNVRQFIDGGTGEVSGYGYVTALNNSASFCGGCELTFQFGGFLPVGGVILPTADTTVFYSGGFLNLYVDFTPDAPAFGGAGLTAANTGDEGGANALWLSLAGHEVGGISFSGTADLFFNTLTGSGLFDVIGGLAAANINTDTIQTLDGTFADLSFTSSFTSGPNGPPTASEAFGTGNFFGNSIPEPATLGVFGLGLLGLSFAGRKRRS